MSRFRFNDGLLIENWSDNWECCNDQWLFHHAFWDWMEATYPGVYAGVEPWTFDELPGWEADPDDRLVALRYVEEFPAQSDDYPIAPGS